MSGIVLAFNLFIAFLLGVGHAEDTALIDPICRSASAFTTIKTIPLKGQPSYFMRAIPDRNMVSMGSDHGNLIVDLDTGKEINVPGPYDPVAISDGSLISVPTIYTFNHKTGQYEARSFNNNQRADYFLRANGQVTNKNGSPVSLTEEELKKRNLTYEFGALTFYSMSDLVVGKAGSKPVLYDRQMEGSYQSFGARSRSSDGSYIQRAIAVGSEILMREYTVKGSGEIVPRGSAKAICKGQPMQLPMMNKQGTELATYNPDKNQMTIYSISDAGACTPIEKIPFPTGKVDFAWQGRKLAFHIDTFNSSDREFIKPLYQSSMSSYVYDRQTKKLFPISDDPTKNTYYPVFLKNGDVAYLSQDRKARDNFSIVVVRPNYAFNNSESSCERCSSDQLLEKQLAVIGALVQAKCSRAMPGQLSIDTKVASLKALNLSEPDCLAISRTFAEANGDYILQTLSYNRSGEKNSVTDDSDFSKITVKNLEDACRWRHKATETENDSDSETAR